MPLVEMRGGALFEIPSVAEIGAELDVRLGPEARRQWHEEAARAADDRERVRLRGLKDFRRSTLLTTPAGTRVSLLDGISPEPGWKWVVRLIGVNLAAAGTGQVFITSDSGSALTVQTQSRPVASFTTSAGTQVEFINAGACILGVDEGLYLNFTQNIQGYMIAGWMSVAERVGELA
jgi:hypothetical protein